MVPGPKNGCQVVRIIGSKEQKWGEEVTSPSAPSEEKWQEGEDSNCQATIGGGERCR